MLDEPHPVPEDSNGLDVDPQVEPADLCNDPGLGLPETPMGSRSPIPSPRRGTRPPNSQITGATSYLGTDWIICMAVPDNRHSCHMQ